MSLLKKASIITTPTAYAEDYLYSIKPAYQISDTELITNGTFDTDSNWTKGTGWSISGGKAVKVAGTGSILSQSNIVEVGKRYRLTFDVIRTAGYIDSIFIGGVSDGTNIETSGSYTYFIKSVNLGALGFNANSSFAGTIDNVSVKEVTDADFDFDRNSTGTRVNEDYLIEDVPYNFVMHSEEFSSSNYTKSGISVVSDDIIAPNGTLTADKIVEDTSNGAHQIFDAVTTNSGNFTNSIMVKAAGRTKIRLSSGSNSHRVDFDLSTATKSNEVGATGSIVSVSDGWYRCVVSWNNTILAAQYLLIALLDNSGNTSYTGDGSSGVYIWGGQLVKGDQPKDYLKTTDRLDIPRIDYTNGEPSILLEPQRQNKVTYSNDFTQWNNISTTLTANYGLSPDGTNNATRLQRSAGVRGVIYNGTSVTSGQSYTISLYVKSLNSTQQIRIGADNGCVNPQGAETFTVGEKWQRISTTITASQTSWNYFIDNVQSGIGCTGTYVGVDILIYGFQVEEGSYATSLIHTSGSAVTRSQDAANNAGNSDLINSTEGVLYLESSALVNDDVNRFIQIHDGTYNNAITLYYSTTENQIIARTWASGSSIVSLNKTLEDATEFHKFAFSYKSGAYKFYIDGRQVATDTNSNTPTGLNQLGFLQGPSGNNFYANTKSVMVFKEALTDLELEKLTGYNNHELYMNYYNRLSYLGLVEEYNVESDINNYIL